MFYQILILHLYTSLKMKLNSWKVHQYRVSIVFVCELYYTLESKWMDKDCKKQQQQSYENTEFEATC